MNQRIVAWEPIEVERLLRELVHPTLSSALLLGALDAGDAQRQHMTDNHPITYGGMVMWGESTCALRDDSANLGWSMKSNHNSETVLSPDERVAILVASGDGWTGVKSADGRPPSTRHAKGLVLRRAIYRNREQAVLGFVPSSETENQEVFRKGVGEDGDEGRPDVICVTWILLHHLVDNSEIRSELSLPLEIDHSGRIGRWKTRLILPRLYREDSPTEQNDNEPVNPIVDIRRRV